MSSRSGGGGNVLLRKSRAHFEIYNDLDGEIVNLFRVARDDGAALVRALELTPFARDEYELSFEDGSTPLEQARRSVVRSFMGVGTNVFKLTKKGLRERTGFRVGSDRQPERDWQNYPDGLRLVIDRLRGVVIEHRDAMDVATDADDVDVLHYFDPPYVFDTRGNSGHDYRHEMSDGDHEVFAAKARALRGMVVISGYPSALYDRLFAGWERVDKRSMADGAQPRIESLWLNPRCSNALHAGPLFAHGGQDMAVRA